MNASQNSVGLKEKQVRGLADQISNAKTLMIVSIKGLPSKQFQDIKKSLREHASIKVVKKNIMERAIKEIGKESILELKGYIKADCAFVISDLEGFELAGILAKKKTPAFAKAGQIATEDIEVKSGPTDLVPGPAISELGSLGLKVAVENGKISIKHSKVVVVKDQVINENAASIFQKLNIQPFSVGLEVLVSYDVENEKIYTDIKIDSEQAAEDLSIAAGKALGFAQKIVYFCKETIGYFLAKANVNGKVLAKFELVEEVKEETKEKEETVEDTTEESEDKKKESENTGTATGDSASKSASEEIDHNEKEDEKENSEDKKKKSEEIKEKGEKNE